MVTSESSNSVTQVETETMDQSDTSPTQEEEKPLTDPSENTENGQNDMNILGTENNNTGSMSRKVLVIGVWCIKYMYYEYKIYNTEWK